MLLITGATGQIGTALMRELASRSVPFRALLRTNAKTTSIRAFGGEVALGDFAQPVSLRAALQGIERVFLLSPLLPDKVRLESNLIAAAKQTGVQTIVKLSAAGAAEHSSALLLKQHGQVERFIEASGFVFTHVRPAPFMQNLAYSAGGIARQGTISLPAGVAQTAFVDVRDIAAVVATVLT
ncbi:MAG: NmrA family NAD(P)-binding protein [Ktedonobacterales bacterium]|nr:NmrA family NAD(P)-binding protein [Ktedonobacterales bacterium]